MVVEYILDSIGIHFFTMVHPPKFLPLIPSILCLFPILCAYFLMNGFLNHLCYTIVADDRKTAAFEGTMEVVYFVQ